MSVGKYLKPQKFKSCFIFYVDYYMFVSRIHWFSMRIEEYMNFNDFCEYNNLQNIVII